MKLFIAQDFAYKALPYVKKEFDKFLSDYSKKTYNQHQYAVLNLLRIWWDCTYREVHKRVYQMPGVKKALELESVPHWTNIQKAFAKHSTSAYRRLLYKLNKDLETGKIAGIDASGFSRARASKHYTKRTGMHLKSLKTTIMVDCDRGWILDIHLTTTRKHDSKIGPKLLRRLPESIEAVTGDKGFDDEKF